MADTPAVPVPPERPDPAALALGRAAARTRFGAAPPEVRERTLDVLVDTLGVIALGCDEPGLVALRGLMPAPPGNSTVVGTTLTAAAPHAAFLNAATTTVHQIDEGHRDSRTHPAIHLVPAVLAVAEERGAGAQEMLSALLAGYEVVSRVGRAAGALRPGVHAHGNSPVLGVAAAVARLLAGEEERVIASAIDGAAAMTLYPQAATTARGATMHYLFAALGVQIGIAAGYGALAGLRPIPGALEGYFGPMAGAGFDPAPLADGIDLESGRWSRYEILNNFFKMYPTCAHTQSINDVVGSLMRQHALDPESVERVDIHTYTAAARMANANPANPLAARFSIPYTVTVQLVSGHLSPDSFPAEPMADPAVGAMIGRVYLHHDPALDEGYPFRGRPASVAIRLKGGGEFRGEAAAPRGDALNPVGRDELHRKVRGLLARRFGEIQANRIFESALELGGGGSLSALSTALREAARP